MVKMKGKDLQKSLLSTAGQALKWTIFIVSYNYID